MVNADSVATNRSRGDGTALGQTCQTMARRESRQCCPSYSLGTDPKGPTLVRAEECPNTRAMQHCGKKSSPDVKPESGVFAPSISQILRLAFWATTLFQNRVLHLWKYALVWRSSYLTLLQRKKQQHIYMHVCVCRNGYSESLLVYKLEVTTGQIIRLFPPSNKTTNIER